LKGVINSKPIPLHPIQTIIKKSKLERKLKIMTINQIKRENNRIHLEVILCARDFEQYFVYCEDCGELIFKEKAIELDGEYYCNSCVEIALIVGFDDPAYFSRLFKQQFGHNPSHYIP
jgi:AraC-like DNA-binding protein